MTRPRPNIETTAARRVFAPLSCVGVAGWCAVLASIGAHAQVASAGLAASAALAAPASAPAVALPARTANAPSNATASADDLKAAYLYKFMAYLEWPSAAFASASSPYVVGVAGSEAVYEVLSRIVAGRLVQGRPMQVRRLAGPAQSDDVHLAFVGKSAWKDLPAWAAAARGRPLALVTDAPRGIENGALLSFVPQETRLRFDASLPAADLSGVKISARLLTVAERVVGGTP